MLRLIAPHHRVSDVCQLTPEQLQHWGIRVLLLDVDCTLTRYRQPEPSPEIAAWIDELRTAGIKLCLISNGMAGRIRGFAERLQLPCVAKALKPLPRGVRAAMTTLGVTAPETAIVGDQLFADIMAGRFAGVRTILVPPIHPEEEPWYTRLKRVPEKWILRRLEG